ncbi:MAG: DUF975 family protein [Oscillospiraceae bacterium]|jgi:uncharacterized membrane protein|nr:DUF975 family protein [Oscillospiraceae bacterium]
MNSFSVSAFKREARAKIRGASKAALLTSVIWFAISALVNLFQTWVSGQQAFMDEFQTAFTNVGTAGYDPNLITELVQNNISPLGTLLSFLLGLCMTVAATGFAWYCLRTARGETLRFTAMFRGFERFSRVIWLSIVMNVFIFLWSLLLVVPGIIASYRYSQAFLVMYDHPEFGALECLRESKELMRDNKLNFFILQLSFIGWTLLGFVIAMYTTIAILNIWIALYTAVTCGVFYNALVGFKPERPEELDAMPPL